MTKLGVHFTRVCIIFNNINAFNPRNNYSRDLLAPWGCFNDPQPLQGTVWSQANACFRKPFSVLAEDGLFNNKYYKK
jgi:hypothetical protein